MTFRLVIIPLVFIVLVLSSCVDSDQSKANNQKKNEKTINEEPPKDNALDNSNGGIGKSDAGNVMRFTMTSGDYSVWGYLLSLSSWAETATDKEVTFLCPNNEIFQPGQKHLISELKRPENKKLLDALMGKHLLKGSMNLEAINKMQSVETITGQILKVDKAMHTIGGVAYTSKEISTEKGHVIILEDLLEYPLLELKESSLKHIHDK